jgi:hypothetical protein
MHLIESVWALFALRASGEFVMGKSRKYKCLAQNTEEPKNEGAGICESVRLPDNPSGNSRIHSTRLTTYFWALVGVWTIILAGFLVLKEAL